MNVKLRALVFCGAFISFGQFSMAYEFAFADDYDNDKDICGTGILPDYIQQESKGYGDGTGGYISRTGTDSFGEAKDQATKKAKELANEDARQRSFCPEKKTRYLSPDYHYAELKEMKDQGDNPKCESGTYQDDAAKWKYACQLQIGTTTDDCDQERTRSDRPYWLLCRAVAVSCLSYKCK